MYLLSSPFFGIGHLLISHDCGLDAGTAAHILSTDSRAARIAANRCSISRAASVLTGFSHVVPGPHRAAGLQRDILLVREC